VNIKQATLPIASKIPAPALPGSGSKGMISACIYSGFLRIRHPLRDRFKITFFYSKFKTDQQLTIQPLIKDIFICWKRLSYRIVL